MGIRAEESAQAQSVGLHGEGHAVRNTRPGLTSRLCTFLLYIRDPSKLLSWNSVEGAPCTSCSCNSERYYVPPLLDSEVLCRRVQVCGLIFPHLHGVGVWQLQQVSRAMPS